MTNQRTTNAALLAARQDVSMTNEVDVAHRLEAHHAHQHAVLFMAPELNSGSNLTIELVRRHVGLVPLVIRDHAPISLSRGVNDRQDGRAIVIAARTDVAQRDELLPSYQLKPHLAADERRAL